MEVVSVGTGESGVNARVVSAAGSRVQAPVVRIAGFNARDTCRAKTHSAAAAGRQIDLVATRALTSTLLTICPAWSATRANLVRVGLALEGARLAVGDRGASPATRGAVVPPVSPAVHDARAGRCQVILRITRKRRLGLRILAVASRDRAMVGRIWLGALHACNVATPHTPDTFERTVLSERRGRGGRFSGKSDLVATRALTSTLLTICPAWSATRANLVRVGLALEGARLAVGDRGASPATRGAVVPPVSPAVHDARAGRCQVILRITRKRRLGLRILAVASRDRAMVGRIWLGALHACNVATQHTPDTFERTVERMVMGAHVLRMQQFCAVLAASHRCTTSSLRIHPGRSRSRCYTCQDRM